jgi:hypothetical protein
MRPSVHLSDYGRVLSESESNNSLGLSAGMSYGRFISNDLLIKGGFGTSISNQAREYPSYHFSLGTQYYYWQDSKLKSYVIGGFSFFRDQILSLNTTAAGLAGIVNDTVEVFHLNQLDASIGTGVQYFINENLALDARFDFTALAITHKNSKKLYQQEYTLRLQPFYTAKSYKDAKEINHFFYKGKTEIFGSMTFAPKTIRAIGTSSFFIQVLQVSIH